MATITTEIRGVSNDTIPMPSEWVAATIRGIRDESPLVKTFRFSLPRIVRHLPGQHYEIRLTAPDGYQAARLYSAASAADDSNELELTIALMPDGEVSTYMHQAAKVGDQVEIRGPLGKFFVWSPQDSQPVLLIAGGTGVVPMRCMLHAHAMHHAQTPIKLLYSVRTEEEMIYKDELLNNPAVTTTITRQASPEWAGVRGRLTPDVLEQTLATLPEETVCYVCGSTPFVEAVADMLVAIGVNAASIKTERFGATR